MLFETASNKNPIMALQLESYPNTLKIQYMWKEYQSKRRW